MNKINGALAYDLPSTGPWAALVFLVSLNLRPSIAAVGPVLSQIGTGLHWAEGVQGVLTAIPLLAFAAVSPLVTFLARRIGIDMSILLALLCIAAGDAIRSFGGGVGIWLGTVVFASAIAVGNVLVPVIAKRDYAGHVAMATGVYSGCITAGSATAGLLSAPLAQMWGGWRASLAFWSVPPLVVAALWALRILHNRKVVIASAGGTIETSDTGDIDDIGDRSTTANAQNPHSAQRPACSTQSSHGVFARVLRRPMTWYVTAFMGLQSSAFYTMSNWMPSISASIGYDASTAGVHLFIFQGIGILSGVGAKELVVSTLGVLYADDAEADAVSLGERIPITPLVAFGYMVFVLIYFPCIATLAAIKGESGSWKWAVFAGLYTTALAWLMSFAIYQIGGLFL